jgi:hypothetical protein
MITLNSVRNERKMFSKNLGVSEDAKYIQQKSDEATQSLIRTVSFGEQVAFLLEELLILKGEYLIPDWDGYNALPISEQSYFNAQQFILALPSSMPLPKLYVIPTGEIVFEWGISRRKVFSVIIEESAQLSYAGLFGTDTIYGTEHFSENLPQIILENIKRVYSTGN